MFWIVATCLVGCFTPKEVEGDEAGECSDQADNDLDGDFDCDDNGCANSPACTETSPTTGVPTGTPSGTTSGSPTGTPALPTVPTDLGELSLFLFRYFDADASVMNDGLSELALGLEAITISGIAADDARVVPILQGADLGTLVETYGAIAAEQVPRGLPTESPHSVTDLVAPALDANQICRMPSDVKQAQRVFLTDATCFANQTCETLETRTEILVENLLMVLAYESYADYRWLEFEAGGQTTDALVSRSWITQPVADQSGPTLLTQEYGLDVVLADRLRPGAAIRWQVRWSSLDSSSLSPELWGSLTVGDLEEVAVFHDEMVSGNEVSCPNDRTVAP